MSSNVESTFMNCQKKPGSLEKMSETDAGRPIFRPNDSKPAVEKYHRTIFIFGGSTEAKHPECGLVRWSIKREDMLEHSLSSSYVRACTLLKKPRMDPTNSHVDVGGRIKFQPTTPFVYPTVLHIGICHFYVIFFFQNVLFILLIQCNVITDLDV
jgi:hypothetical protein